MPEETGASDTGEPEDRPRSESEEMYLITVARAEEGGATGPVPVTAIAAALRVSVAAANEMIRKLAGRGLFDYRPYRGVELTAAGRRIAERVLRTRRLWAAFLAGHLEYTPVEADALACHLEHVTPPETSDRLAAWLGDPDVGPLGHRIPHPATADRPPASVPLLDADPGIALEVLSVTTGRSLASFLASEGIAPGREIRVAGRGPSALLVETAGGHVHLDHAAASGIGVRTRRDGS
jgi:DtxR family Mn-dependent transcriptional regulator